LQGAAAVCEGRYDEAIPLLDAAVATDKSDTESRVWRAEALTRLGRWKDATGDIEANLRVDGSLAVAVVRVWHDCKVSLNRSALWSRVFSPHVVDLTSGLYARIKEIASVEEWAVASKSPQATVELLEEVLAALRGNRSSRPTALRGQPRLNSAVEGLVDLADLEYLSFPRNVREMASDNLRALAQLGPDAVRAKMLTLAQRYEYSPQPWCYLGELELWLGNLDAAETAFDTGNRRLAARWAYIGKAAIHFLRGQFWRARWTIFRLRFQYRPLAASTLPVYRGEGLRRAGKHQKAIGDLQQAIHHKPSRLGARMNLVLSLLALGRRDEASAELAEVVRQAPGIIWAAKESRGAITTANDDLDKMSTVLEACLEMMRGNRSSTQLTYFTDEGQFRMPVAPNVCRDLAKDLTLVVAHLAATELREPKP